MNKKISDFKLRSWQEEAMSVWSKDMRGVVSVVTGGGKTFFALMCVIKFFEKFKDGRVVIIVPTIALQDQWSLEIISILGVKDKKTSLFPNKKSKLNLFNVVVINTARNIDKKSFLGAPTFLIVDECHKSGSKENSKSLKFSSVAQLGLSATPKRDSDSGFEDYILPSLGKIIYKYDYKQAFKDGVISNFNMTNVRTNLEKDEERDVASLTKRIAIELSKKVVNFQKVEMLQIRKARIVKGSINRIPVALKIILSLKNKKTIVFCESIKQADYISSFLTKKGKFSTVYHTKIGRNIRKSNLLLFKKGIYRVLVTCTALDEGLNVPDINVAVIVSQTMSSRQRIQRLGRALRKGKDLAEIYTIYITEDEKDFLIREFSNLREISNFNWQKIEV
nr:conserved hypothetical protein [uncultured bacterium]